MDSRRLVPQRRTRYVAGLALGAVVVLGASIATAIAFNQNASDGKRVRAVIESRFAARTAYTVLLDQDAGVSGYVATGDRSFLASFDTSGATYAAMRLRLLGPADPVISAPLRRFLGTANALGGYFAGEIALVRTGHADRARAGLRLARPAFDRLRRSERETALAFEAVLATLRASARATFVTAEVLTSIMGFVLLLAGIAGAALIAGARRDRILAHSDELTGLPNRRAFLARLAAALRARGANQMVGLLYLDLDHFKEVNDQFGHAVGDEILVRVARRLGRALRPPDLAFRLAGDEFGVLLGGLTNAQEAPVVARRVDDALNRPFGLGERQLQVGASIGIALAPQDGETPEDLLAVADAAMYRAKPERDAPPP